MSASPGRTPGILAALLALAALFLLASGALVVLSARGAAGTSAVPTGPLYALALDAHAAATGSQEALGRFQQNEKALEEADGDVEQAIEILRVKGVKDAGKRAERTAANGLVTAELDGTTAGVMIQC